MIETRSARFADFPFGSGIVPCCEIPLFLSFMSMEGLHTATYRPATLLLEGAARHGARSCIVKVACCIVVVLFVAMPLQLVRNRTHVTSSAWARTHPQLQMPRAMHHFQSGPHSKGDTTMYVGNAHSALVEMQTGVVDGRVPNVASIDTPSAMPPVAELTYQTAFNLLFFVGAVVLLLVGYKMNQDQQAARRKAAAAESWTTLYASDDEYIIYEKDDKGVVMLSHGGESNLWMGQCDPNNPLDFGLEYFRSQVTSCLVRKHSSPCPSWSACPARGRPMVTFPRASQRWAPVIECGGSCS